ncbi:MAG: RluA family pseudouridine synthase [Lachnospiraceae bacterium]|nr:RluA family pseudouridine synthase [Lachnospiraceae bacterium]
MTRILEYKITEQFDSMPINFFLKSMGFSRQCIIALKKQEKGILLNGIWAYVNTNLCPGDTLTLTLSEDESSEKIPPVNLPLSIIYEDEDILVLNKPANMPIHPSLNNYENTLANAVAYYYDSQNIPFVFRCINRLDRDTTGVTMLAKNPFSAGILSEMVRNRQIHREYLAITSGIFDTKEGIVDAPIARKEGSAIEREVNFETGEHAITHYTVLKENKDLNCSLLKIWLETGRTHQIRVHMKHLGHPLPGDFLYNPDMTHIKRQALHSYSLSFNHPITKKPMQFIAPVPSDMNFC